MWFAFITVCTIGLLWICIRIHEVLHELGHLLGGLLSGYRYLSLRIGRIALVRRIDRLTFIRLKSVSSGGQCLMTPPISYEYSSWFWYTSGGILCNFFFGIIGFIAFGVLSNNVLRYITVCFGSCGLVTAIMAAIPRTKEVVNDGATILELLRDPDARRAYWEQGMVVAWWHEGRPYYKFEWSRIPILENIQSELCLFIRGIWYYGYLETGEIKKAEKELRLLEAAKDYMSQDMRESILVERYYLELLKSNIDVMDPNYLDVKMMLIGESTVTKTRVHHLEALRTGRIAEAVAIEKDFIRDMNSNLLLGDAVSNLHIMVANRKEAEERWRASDES